MLKKASGDTSPKSISGPPSRINSVNVEILSQNSSSFVSCIPNFQEPIPFETELFSGVFMFALRTAPLDPNFQHFFHDELVCA